MENKQDKEKALLFLVFAVLILAMTISIKFIQSDNEFVNFLPILLSAILLIVDVIFTFKTNVFKNAKQFNKIIYSLIVFVTWMVILIF